MIKFIKYYPYIMLMYALFLTIGYSAFSSELVMSNVAITVRPEKNIRVTSFYSEGTENDGQSLWSEYSVNKILADINLPNATSTVSYRVGITNLGGVSMGITNIIGLPSNLEILYTDYNLGETLCDVNKTENQCKYGAYDEFGITIKYKDGMYTADNTQYQLRLELNFDSRYTVNYLSNDLSYSITPSPGSSKDKIVSSNGVYTITKNTNYAGLRIPSEHFTDNETYLLRYKIKKTSGKLVNIGGHALYTYEKSFLIDSKPSLYKYDQPRENIIDDTNEHIIEFKFTYDVDIKSTSTSKDLNVYIQPNRKSGDPVPIVINIYDIELFKVISENEYSYEEIGITYSGISKTGYNFIEWNTDLNRNGISYIPGSEFSSLTSDNGKQINLYAIWEAA